MSWQPLLAAQVVHQPWLVSASPRGQTEIAAAQSPGGHFPLKIYFVFNELLLFTRLRFPREAEAATSLVKKDLRKAHLNFKDLLGIVANGYANWHRV